MLINKYLFSFMPILMTFLITFSSAVQAFTLSDLQQKLATQQLVSGQYTQIKHMQIFKQPLRSKGDFVLSQKEGLEWLQKKPFPVSIILSQNKLSQQFADSPAQIIDAADNPMAFYFSHLFLSLFKGDVNALAAQFEMQLQGDTKQWQLLLTPKEAPLNKVFEEISISGSEFINELQLIELKGDYSIIYFTNQSYTPTSLSND